MCVLFYEQVRSTVKIIERMQPEKYFRKACGKVTQTFVPQHQCCSMKVQFLMKKQLVSPLFIVQVLLKQQNYTIKELHFFKYIHFCLYLYIIFHQSTANARSFLSAPYLLVLVTIVDCPISRNAYERFIETVYLSYLTTLAQPSTPRTTVT